MIFHIFDAERKRGRTTEKNDAWLLCLLSIILLRKSYQFISMEAWNVKMETKMLHNGKNKQLAGCLTIKVVERG